MKIWYAPYELYPLNHLNRFKKNSRRGFLIKIQNKNIKEGYADCHPIAEFGDEDVAVLLQRLALKKWTPLLKRSIHFAKVDGQAREEKKNLFSYQKIKSHYTCSDVRILNAKKLEQLIELGFSTVKIKVGRDVRLETHYLNRIPLKIRTLLRWRFDANGGGGEPFLKMLDENYREITDFIEDPMPFNKKKWHHLGSTYSMACAFDHPTGTRGKADFRGIRILKPAREIVSPRKKDVITNSMDHPVGQSFAYWTAQSVVKKFKMQPCDYGLQTAHLFKSNAFFEQIKTSSAHFKVSDGWGVGFDSLLKREKWLPL